MDKQDGCGKGVVTVPERDSVEMVRELRRVVSIMGAEDESRARTDRHVAHLGAMDRASFEGWVTLVAVLVLAAVLGWWQGGLS